MPRSIDWLKASLSVSVILLICQLLSVYWDSARSVIDARRWSQSVWFLVNVGALVLLMVVRFGPEIFQELKNSSQKRRVSNMQRQKVKEQQELRETLSRIKEARKRRFY